MDEEETVTKDQEQLDHLGEEIKEARHHLNDETNVEEERPEFFEDDQTEPEEEAEKGPEGPGSDNPPG